ncbi:MAG: hypothetical protein JWM10_3772, partial [Myxococcaceae bacterium]|nr:hypothetical protein [Myxococcaceae bacterium]
MRLARPLLAALAALSLRCTRAPPARAPRPVIAPLPSPPALPPARAEAWSAAFAMRRGVADFAPSPDVAVHAPPGFDDRAPLHLVIVLHGMG